MNIDKLIATATQIAQGGEGSFDDDNIVLIPNNNIPLLIIKNAQIDFSQELLNKLLETDALLKVGFDYSGEEIKNITQLPDYMTGTLECSTFENYLTTLQPEPAILSLSMSRLDTVDSFLFQGTTQFRRSFEKMNPKSYDVYLKLEDAIRLKNVFPDIELTGTHTYTTLSAVEFKTAQAYLNNYFPLFMGDQPLVSSVIGGFFLSPKRKTKNELRALVDIIENSIEDINPIIDKTELDEFVDTSLKLIDIHSSSFDLRKRFYQEIKVTDLASLFVGISEAQTPEWVDYIMSLVEYRRVNDLKELLYASLESRNEKNKLAKPRFMAVYPGLPKKMPYDRINLIDLYADNNQIRITRTPTGYVSNLFVDINRPILKDVQKHVLNNVSKTL